MKNAMQFGLVVLGYFATIAVVLWIVFAIMISSFTHGCESDGYKVEKRGYDITQFNRYCVDSNGNIIDVL